MIKGLFGGLFVLGALGWSGYVLSSPEPCERVYRLAGPVRGSFDAVRWMGQNWLSTDSRLKLLLWSSQADQGSRDVIERTLYGKTAQCGEKATAEWNKRKQALAANPAKGKEAAPAEGKATPSENKPAPTPADGKDTGQSSQVDWK